METQKRYTQIACIVQTLSQFPTGERWILFRNKWEEELKTLLETAPSGSGFDNGTKFIQEKSGPDRLEFHTSFHHMDSFGGYVGWTEHNVICKPDLTTGMNIVVRGKNINQIKGYIFRVFYDWLNEDIMPFKISPSQS